MIAQWGVGSRARAMSWWHRSTTLRGWWVRGDDGLPGSRRHFTTTRTATSIGLYIRYSQVANDYNNVDNWPAYGLYQGSAPLARGASMARSRGRSPRRPAIDCRSWLRPEEARRCAGGVEEPTLTKRSTKILELAARLCQAAYVSPGAFGIKYVLVVLDELETAAEAATYGLDATGHQHLDGRAIADGQGHQE